jgi:hypothetical protein
MYSVTENIYYSQLSSVAILQQPEPNCFTSYNTRKGLCSLSLCAIVLRSPPPSHVSISNDQRSSQLLCVRYSALAPLMMMKITPVLKLRFGPWSSTDYSLCATDAESGVTLLRTLGTRNNDIVIVHETNMTLPLLRWVNFHSQRGQRPWRCWFGLPRNATTHSDCDFHCSLLFHECQ